MGFLLTDNAKFADGKPRVSMMPYAYDIAEGNVANHEAWSKIGYTPTMNATESDLWSAAGVYAFPTAAETWEVVGAAADDATPVLVSGTSTGGSTTTVVHNTNPFGAVVAGDCVILDKSGASPEYGWVTSATASTLTCAGGFSKGGSGASRGYSVTQYGATSGAHAVKIQYLTTGFVEKEEIVILNGVGAVSTINNDCYRVNSFRVIAAGSTNAAANPGGITLRVAGGGASRSYISGGYTRARNAQYTVPTGKTLYVTQFSVSYGTTGNANKEYARLYTRANYNAGFKTGYIFYPYTEVLIQNNTAPVTLLCPTKLGTGIDIKVSGIASAAGVATVALRGWLERA
jgi:hypothetical protein